MKFEAAALACVLGLTVSACATRPQSPAQPEFTLPPASPAGTPPQDGLVCLPTDGLCVTLPDGWRVVAADSQRGPAGTAESVVALGPADARLELAGGPATDLGGCSAVVTPPQLVAASLDGVQVASAGQAEGVTSWLRPVAPACAEADALIPSPVRGRVISARASARQDSDLTAATQALASAQWR